MKGPGRLGRALHEEHFWTLVVMAGLEERVSGAAASVPLDPRCCADHERLEETLALLDDMIRHNAFEEGVLFPTLWDRGAADMTRVFTEDHADLGPLCTRLRRLTRDLLAGDTSPPVWQAFCGTALHLSAQVMIHLQKEEMALVRHLGSILGDRLDQSLEEQFQEQKRRGRDALKPAAGRPLAVRRTPMGGSADLGAVHSYRKDADD
jgi:hemerythrin-like domain-containing protein